MKSRVRRVLAPLVLAAVPLIALARPALADPPMKSVYEIEALTAYCQGHEACSPTSNVEDLRFALAEAFRFAPVRDTDPDSASGTPDLVHAVCARHYLDGNGTLHAVSIDFISVKGAPGAKIKGTASVREGLETDTRGVGRINVKAWDGIGQSVEIKGTQVTNNATDSRVSGGFEVELHGMLMDSLVEPQAPPATPIGMGEMECRTNVAPALNPFHVPPDFASEVNDPPEGGGPHP